MGVGPGLYMYGHKEQIKTINARRCTVFSILIKSHQRSKMKKNSFVRLLFIIVILLKT